MPSSITKSNQRISPRLIATNPVNGRVTIQLPADFVMIFSQLLNTIGKRSDYLATCITCEHFKNNLCMLCNQLPPPEIIANGCESYEDKDYVPF